jgi:hypothetical protein
LVYPFKKLQTLGLLPAVSSDETEQNIPATKFDTHIIFLSDRRRRELFGGGRPDPVAVSLSG